MKLQAIFVLIIALSILHSTFSAESESNRYLLQDSTETPEYRQKIKALVDKSRQDKENGVETDEKDMIYVHVVPHSHDDVGFRKTLDQYFSGSHDMIIRSGVQYIIRK